MEESQAVSGNRNEAPSALPGLTSTSEIAFDEQATGMDPVLPEEGEGAQVESHDTEGTSPPIKQHDSDMDHIRQEDGSGGVDLDKSDSNVEEEDITAAEDWDPLRSAGKDSHSEVDHRDLDPTLMVVVEESGVVSSTGGSPHVDGDGVDEPHVQSPTTTTSRRVSHLHLDLKAASPPLQPWDNEGPLSSLAHGKKEYHESVSAIQPKFPTHSRPLKPKSSYYFGPPPPGSAFGTPPMGQIGVHHPREMVRVERDYSGGELPQFAAIYPLEFEGRISPTQFLESINSINEVLISAYSLRHSFVDNLLATFSLQISKLLLKTHYEKEMERLQDKFKELNETLYNPVGLNILWPRNVAFLFLEIEYY